MLAAQLSTIDWFVSSALVAAGLGVVLAVLRRTRGRMLG
jgi:hypothetical protein